jgi:hypothetical protein
MIFSASTKDSQQRDTAVELTDDASDDGLGPAEPGSQKMDSLMIQILFGHYF